MTRFRFSILATLLIALNAAATAQANFNIVIGNATISPSGSATINVTINAVAGTSLTSLDSFAFRLLITPINGTQTQLGFTTTQPQPYNNSSYVFYNDSLNNDPSNSTPVPIGNVTTTTTPRDTYTGGDATDDGATKLISTTGQLLFSFQVAGIAAALPKQGDKFQVALVAASSTSGGNFNSSHLLH